MKTIFKSALALFIVFTSMLSCVKSEIDTRDTDSPNFTNLELISVTCDPPYEISVEAAQGILDNFISNELQGKSTAQQHHPTIKYSSAETFDMKCHKIIDTRSSIDSDTLTKIYRFELTTGSETGFALVSADKRAPSIITYIPHTSETIIPEEAEIMLDIAIQSHISDIIRVEQIKDSLREPTYQKISKHLNLPIDRISSKDINKIIEEHTKIPTRSRAITEPPTRQYSFVLPLIYTKWNQYSPYNMKHPDILFNQTAGTYSKPNAGCAPVAIAQIFAYCEVPMFRAQGIMVDWDLLTKTPKIDKDSIAAAETVGNLMYEIFEKIEAEYMYGENGIHSGTAAYPNKFIPYIQETISTGEDQEYDWDIIKESLTSLEPVIIYGQSHCWILDGYAICEKQAGIFETGEYDIYLTANFGWGGIRDGYYKIDGFTHSANFYDKYYSSELRIIPNCKNF